VNLTLRPSPSAARSVNRSVQTSAGGIGHSLPKILKTIFWYPIRQDRAAACAEITTGLSPSHSLHSVSPR